MLRSVLVPLDLSPGSRRVLDRAAALPLSDRARLTLLHVVPPALSASARRRAEKDAHLALADAAQRLARHVGASVRIERVVTAGPSAARITERAARSRVELILVGRVGARPLRDFFLGSTAERVTREARRPVLVVRLPADGPYRRPMMAVEQDEAAFSVLAHGLRLLPLPRPPIDLVHAFEAIDDLEIYPSLSSEELERHRRENQRRAKDWLAQCIAGLRLHDVPNVIGTRWQLQVRDGSPRRVIPAAVKKRKTDLLVLGTHGRSAMGRAFLGTVAGDVLREVSCDVLVVPPSA